MFLGDDNHINMGVTTSYIPSLLPGSVDGMIFTVEIYYLPVWFTSQHLLSITTRTNNLPVAMVFWELELFTLYHIVH